MGKDKKSVKGIQIVSRAAKEAFHRFPSNTFLKKGSGAERVLIGPRVGKSFLPYFALIASALISISTSSPTRAPPVSNILL